MNATAPACDCLHCRIHHLATSDVADEGEAVMCVATVLGRLLVNRSDLAFAGIVAQVAQARDLFRELAGSNVIPIRGARHA